MSSPIKNAGKDVILWLSLGFYFVFLLYGSLFPFDFREINPSGLLGAAKTLLTDFLSYRHISKIDVLINLFIYVPFGFLVSTLIFRRVKSMAPVFIGTLLAGAAVSFSVELLQVFAPGRYSSLIDILLNSMGMGTGVVLAVTVLGLAAPGEAVREGASYQKEPLLVLCLLYGIAVAASGIAGGVEFLLFATFAALCHFALWGGAPSSAALEFITIFLTAALGTGVALGRFFLKGERVEAASILVASLAGIAGILAASPLEKLFFASPGPRPAALPKESRWFLSFLFELAAALWYAGILTAFLLTPFQFNFSPEYLSERISLPGLLGFNTLLEAREGSLPLQDVLFTVLIYAPLGGLFYYALRRFPLARAAAILLCLAHSTFVEGVQIFIPARYPEVSDILVATAGSLLGIWAVQRYIEPGEARKLL